MYICTKHYSNLLNLLKHIFLNFFYYSFCGKLCYFSSETPSENYSVLLLSLVTFPWYREWFFTIYSHIIQHTCDMQFIWTKVLNVDASMPAIYRLSLLLTRPILLSIAALCLPFLSSLQHFRPQKSIISDGFISSGFFYWRAFETA